MDQFVSATLVATDRPGRYAKQLASHMSRKISTAFDPNTGLGFLDFNGRGRARLVALDEGLRMELFCEETEMPRLEQIIGSHLARFGWSEQMQVAWTRADGTPGDVSGPYTKEEIEARRKAKQAAKAAAAT
ncbi:hypothetical protein BK816_07875 [Boudabousia tangfeifanii]|uniref:DUF2218 domain-containing protein n=1 Tax=Boudabousia tangfeifanii TaxID=1912795 RepID=A0A1D9MLU9_9ACTO|nr:DUF2218 domain-containing protein [Boudabousia tangfeifanii]AOZ73218.1 hypothetical protein BK816_07875 [Boudabousia tangfeifanii]